jgi:hypothetical protein
MLTGLRSRTSAAVCRRGRSAYSEISKNCGVLRRNCNASAPHTAASGTVVKCPDDGVERKKRFG